MENNCKLCGGKYDFRIVKIDEYLNTTGIAFSGSKRQVNNDNRFRFCPNCGRKLTKEDFGGVDFGDKPDMREKIREYINELDTEIDRCENELQKYYKSNGDIGVISMQNRIQVLIEVKNDLLGRLEEVI